jgi:hypothetical protein
MRLAGEILLRYYDRLIREGLASPLPDPPRTRTEYDLRLKRRPLDSLLTAFGLSPHPQLVLIVEGLTELVLVPRAMEVLGVSTDEDFIAILDAEGVSTNLNALLAYLAPQPGGEREGTEYFLPARPLTRFLIVFDPEGPAATEGQREKKRKNWVDRIMRAMPRELQTTTVREAMDTLVAIRTWNERGESFEYAHFSDEELAQAIDSLDTRERKPTYEDLVERLDVARAENWNLKKLLHGPGKADLASALWPVLERKMEVGLTQELGDEIPVVRVIYEAEAMAHEYGRGNTVIGLTPRPRRGGGA